MYLLRIGDTVRLIDEACGVDWQAVGLCAIYGAAWVAVVWALWGLL
jgi:hypothetical protein